MKVIYIAEDGIEFDNETDCENHEWLMKYPSLNDVRFYDKDGSLVVTVFADESYNRVTRIMVPDKDALKDFREFIKYTGFEAYAYINNIGEWMYDEYSGEFVKAEDKMFSWIARIDGEHVMGIVKAANMDSARYWLKNTYKDFDSWEYCIVKPVVFNTLGVCECHYGS